MTAKRRTHTDTSNAILFRQKHEAFYTYFIFKSADETQRALKVLQSQKLVAYTTPDPLYLEIPNVGENYFDCVPALRNNKLTIEQINAL